MTWVLVIGLAVAAFVLAAFVLKAPRGSREAIGAALLFGIAGYGLQGSPWMAGAPKQATEQTLGEGASAVEERKLVNDSSIPPTDRWVVVSNAMMRNGQYADAAEVLKGATEADPKNGDAWLAMGNALVAHADGLLTPGALYAFRRAAAAAPEDPGPPFFLGLAMAQSGQLAQARELWLDLLSRTPADAPWRADLVDKLGRLERIIAAQQGAGPGVDQR